MIYNTYIMINTNSYKHTYVKNTYSAFHEECEYRQPA